MDKGKPTGSTQLKNNWEAIYTRVKNLRSIDDFNLETVYVNELNFGDKVKKEYDSEIKYICSKGKIYTRVFLLKSDVMYLMYCIEEGDCGDEDGYGVEPDTWIIAYVDRGGNFLVPFELGDSSVIKAAEKIYGF
jgi:hypothetical protein